MAQRPQLSLTAELEKLEQQITLTLQEIDHNFARAHRIVTTSILPIVERYAQESERVWDGSKFWKQFFETSANVALSNYQETDEPYGDQTEMTEQPTATYAEESTYPASSPGHYPAERTAELTRETKNNEQTLRDDNDDDVDDTGDIMDDSLLESLNLNGGATQSTPRRRDKAPQREEWADLESPFDALQRELTMKNYDDLPGTSTRPPQKIALNLDSTIDGSSALPPATPPQLRRHLFDADSTPESSSPLREPPMASSRTPGTVNRDPVLHRVLDKTWRLQATPLGKPAPSRYRPTAGAGAITPQAQTRRPFYLDDSPMSSPIEPVLHTQVFTPAAAIRGLRTPKAKQYGMAAMQQQSERTAYPFNDDDSDDDILLPPGMSPPKTMQFSMPQSKLLATPAREASKRIVHDILQTAGASLDFTTSTTDSSPPRGRGSLEDDDPF